MNRSIRKAFDVLSFITENPGRMSLVEMSVHLGMNKTTLYRFLTTLENMEILDRKDDCYIPGIKLFELGSKVPIKRLLVDKVHPILIRLTAEVNETVNLGELHNNQVLYLDKTESQRRMQIHTSIGSHTALHATALGKSILSILPGSLRETIINGLHFEKRTHHTITGPRELRTHVEKVWKDGYSTDCEEFEEGLHCAAVPLLLEELDFYGAVSCSGSTVRFTTQRMAELAGKLKETKEEIKNLFKKGESR